MKRTVRRHSARDLPSNFVGAPMAAPGQPAAARPQVMVPGTPSSIPPPMAPVMKAGNAKDDDGMEVETSAK
eukprot:12907520-Prorocentrum_lima.AAC.1